MDRPSLDRRTLERRTLDRRTFIGTLTAAAVLTPRWTWAAESHRIEKIGVQLYTVRDEMKKDFDGTIAKVAAIGYREVEFAGYFDHTPQQVRALLDRNKLTAPSVHVDYKSLGEKFPQVLRELSGLIRIGVPRPAIFSSCQRSWARYIW